MAASSVSQRTGNTGRHPNRSGYLAVFLPCLHVGITLGYLPKVLFFNAFKLGAESGNQVISSDEASSS
jgi:hypothetical protein